MRGRVVRIRTEKDMVDKWFHTFMEGVLIKEGIWYGYD